MQDRESGGNRLGQSHAPARLRIGRYDLFDDGPPEISQGHQRPAVEQTLAHHLPRDGKFHERSRGSRARDVAVPLGNQLKESLLSGLLHKFVLDPRV